MASEKTLRKIAGVVRNTGIAVLILSLVFVFLFARKETGKVLASQSTDQGGPRILVGLVKCQELSVFLSGNYNLVLFDSNTSSMIQPPQSLPKGSTLQFQRLGNGVVCSSPDSPGLPAGIQAKCAILSPLSQISSGANAANGNTPSGSTPVSTPADEDAALTIKEIKGQSDEVRGTTFPGSLVVMVDGDRLYVANLVDIEEYVSSVVSAEMPASFPLEAKKAQALVARTYAAYKSGLNSVTPQKDSEIRCYSPKDVLISDEDQVYRGLSGVDPIASQAVAMTKGLIITYQGKAIASYFHADAVTMTEDARYVWGGSFPYLKPVAEVPHMSPYTYWEESYSPDQFSPFLAKLGLKGDLLSVKGLSPGPSGRWSEVSIQTDSGEVKLKPTEFRSLTGLKSMLFSVYTVGDGETRGQMSPGLTVYVQGASQVTAEKTGGLWAVGGAGEKASLNQGCYAVAPPAGGAAKLVFEGEGWGHGVGLSQWGAKAMAEEGRDFREIVMHYYAGISIEQWW